MTKADAKKTVKTTLLIILIVVCLLPILGATACGVFNAGNYPTHKIVKPGELVGFWASDRSDEDIFYGYEFRSDGTGSLYVIEAADYFMSANEQGNPYANYARAFTYSIQRWTHLLIEFDDKEPGDSQKSSWGTSPVSVDGDTLTLWWPFELGWYPSKHTRLSSIEYEDGILTATTLDGKTMVYGDMA